MRPAVWRFGALAIAACWTGRTESTIDNHAAAAEVTGGYWCSIESGGYQYPQFPCTVRRIDGHLTLAKLGGSQRFHGELAPVAAGYRFDGELFCPYGDCTEEMHGTFVAQGRELRGHFGAMTVRMTPAPDSAFGGLAYGGDSYATGARGGR